MGDHVGTEVLERAVERLPVGDRALDQGQSVPLGRLSRRPVAKLSMTRTSWPSLKQPLGQMGADEAAPACDQNLHEAEECR